MFYDIFSKLCKSINKSPSAVAAELGINKSNVSNWKNNGYTPRGEVLQKIADHFNVTTDYLLGYNIHNIVSCPDCGMTYCISDDEGFNLHEKKHKAWEKAVTKFGFCWNYRYREAKKADARAVINNPASTDEQKYDAQITVFKALFSRSLEASQYSLNHVDFETYVAMLLPQQQWVNGIPDSVYSRMEKEFGKKSGISSGSYYFVKQNEISNEAYVMSFSEKLRDAREKIGYTQQQIADAMGIDKSTYCGYETGKRQPDINKIKQLSAILNVSGDELLETGFAKKHTEDQGENVNIIKIAGRDGSFEERHLTDQQLAALKAIIEQLPDASEDL